MNNDRLKFLDEPPIPFDNARFTREAEEAIAKEEAEKRRHERAVQYVKEYDDHINYIAEHGYPNQKEPLPGQEWPPHTTRPKRPAEGSDATTSKRSRTLSDSGPVSSAEGSSGSRTESERAYQNTLKWAKGLQHAIAMDAASASPRERWLFWSDDGSSLIMKQSNGFVENLLDVYLASYEMVPSTWNDRMKAYGFKKSQEIPRRRTVPLSLTHPKINRDTPLEDMARAMADSARKTGGAPSATPSAIDRFLHAVRTTRPEPHQETREEMEEARKEREALWILGNKKFRSRK